MNIKVSNHDTKMYTEAEKNLKKTPTFTRNPQNKQGPKKSPTLKKIQAGL